MSGETALRTLSHIALAAQFSLGIVFLLSAVPKLRRPRLFAWGVVAYDILPEKVSYVFALALIPLELFLAITFLTGWLMSIALALATLLLVVFTVAVGINLRRGRLVDCGCFGAGSEPISTRSVARLFLLLTVVLLLAALRATGSAVPLTLDLASLTNPVTFAYLLQAAMLATFLILLGVWMLRLPELVLFVRR